jgi:hypothetical protein
MLLDVQEDTYNSSKSHSKSVKIQSQSQQTVIHMHPKSHPQVIKSIFNASDLPELVDNNRIQMQQLQLRTPES